MTLKQSHLPSAAAMLVRRSSLFLSAAYYRNSEMSPWESTIWRKRRQVQSLSRAQSSRFALLCVEHAFRSSKAYFQCRLDAALLDRVDEIIGFLWKQIIRTNKRELDPVISELERLTPSEDDEEDLVWGWGYVPSGLAAAACCLRGKKAGEYALKSAGEAYSCIAHQVSSKRIYSHGEGIAGDEIDELERDSNRCMREVRFQNTCLQLLAKGERLTQAFLHQTDTHGTSPDE